MTRIWRGIGQDRRGTLLRGGGIDHPQHEIGVLDSGERPPDPLSFDRTLRSLLSPPCR